MSEPTVRMRLARVEGIQLAQLVDDLRDLVGSERDVSDPAISRLAPDPYPDDEDESRSFREATRDDLLDRRALDAEVVRAALGSLRGDMREISPTEAVTEHDLLIPHADVDAWLRTLTTLRLVIAERLGVESDDDRDPEDARFDVYDWLGYRLELLIDAADEFL